MYLCGEDSHVWESRIVLGEIKHVRQALEEVLERMSSGDLKSICRNKRLESLIFEEKLRSGF